MGELTSAQLALRARMTMLIGRYTGWDIRPRDVEVAEDPQVEGVYAIQVTRRDGPHQFLYDEKVGTGDDGVAEVEFPTWPPTIRWSK
jgi:hypothetical protein